MAEGGAVASRAAVSPTHGASGLLLSPAASPSASTPPKGASPAAWADAADPTAVGRRGTAAALEHALAMASPPRSMGSARVRLLQAFAAADVQAQSSLERSFAALDAGGSAAGADSSGSGSATPGLESEASEDLLISGGSFEVALQRQVRRQEKFSALRKRCTELQAQAECYRRKEAEFVEQLEHLMAGKETEVGELKMQAEVLEDERHQLKEAALQQDMEHDALQRQLDEMLAYKGASEVRVQFLMDHLVNLLSRSDGNTSEEAQLHGQELLKEVLADGEEQCRAGQKRLGLFTRQLDEARVENRSRAQQLSDMQISTTGIHEKMCKFQHWVLERKLFPNVSPSRLASAPSASTSAADRLGLASLGRTVAAPDEGSGSAFRRGRFGDSDDRASSNGGSPRGLLSGASPAAASDGAASSRGGDAHDVSAQDPEATLRSERAQSSLGSPPGSCKVVRSLNRSESSVSSLREDGSVVMMHPAVSSRATGAEGVSPPPPPPPLPLELLAGSLPSVGQLARASEEVATDWVGGGSRGAAAVSEGGMHSFGATSQEIGIGLAGSSSRSFGSRVAQVERCLHEALSAISFKAKVVRVKGDWGVYRFGADIAAVIRLTDEGKLVASRDYSAFRPVDEFLRELQAEMQTVSRNVSVASTSAVAGASACIRAGSAQVPRSASSSSSHAGASGVAVLTTAAAAQSAPAPAATASSCGASGRQLPIAAGAPGSRRQASPPPEAGRLASTPGSAAVAPGTLRFPLGEPNARSSRGALLGRGRTTVSPPMRRLFEAQPVTYPHPAAVALALAASAAGGIPSSGSVTAAVPMVGMAPGPTPPRSAARSPPRVPVACVPLVGVPMHSGSPLVVRGVRRADNSRSPPMGPPGTACAASAASRASPRQMVLSPPHVAGVTTANALGTAAQQYWRATTPPGRVMERSLSGRRCLVPAPGPSGGGGLAAAATLGLRCSGGSSRARSSERSLQPVRVLSPSPSHSPVNSHLLLTTGRTLSPGPTSQVFISYEPQPLPQAWPVGMQVGTPVGPARNSSPPHVSLASRRLAVGSPVLPAASLSSPLQTMAGHGTAASTAIAAAAAASAAAATARSAKTAVAAAAARSETPPPFATSSPSQGYRGTWTTSCSMGRSYQPMLSRTAPAATMQGAAPGACTASASMWALGGSTGAGVANARVGPSSVQLTSAPMSSNEVFAV
eukprot:CAMPEP_0203884088 /NCGR_PEP_ID=MMETSP0359-20131031/28155_1 /ASSEMBLY_ACC=CAM_ASM_000338 /TAXON_ID=268821 /ORGANISM="Scrippsiella Hangoei, Strain SHTV-5" /LENGTH=1196 /DNA_ID=CAMNT_0050804469 /DNA_START=23 /DNA_END=3613 /DNA_ORIENTATION=-